MVVEGMPAGQVGGKPMVLRAKEIGGGEQVWEVEGRGLYSCAKARVLF